MLQRQPAKVKQEKPNPTKKMICGAEPLMGCDYIVLRLTIILSKISFVTQVISAQITVVCTRKWA